MKKLIKRLFMWLKIPRGDYCYKIVKIENDTGYIKCKYCPHHYINLNKHNQENGGCVYLGIEDDEDDTLLWNYVKECGVKK